MAVLKQSSPQIAQFQPNFINDQALAVAAAADAFLEEVSGSLEIEQKSPIQPTTRPRRILAFWPWAWLALAGFVTIAWAIALGGAAFGFVQWIVD
jgi:hypothetical protein